MKRTVQFDERRGARRSSTCDRLILMLCVNLSSALACETGRFTDPSLMQIPRRIASVRFRPTRIAVGAMPVGCCLDAHRTLAFHPCRIHSQFLPRTHQPLTEKTIIMTSQKTSRQEKTSRKRCPRRRPRGQSRTRPVLAHQVTSNADGRRAPLGVAPVMTIQGLSDLNTDGSAEELAGSDHLSPPGWASGYDERRAACGTQQKSNNVWLPAERPTKFHGSRSTCWRDGNGDGAGGRYSPTSCYKPPESERESGAIPSSGKSFQTNGSSTSSPQNATRRERPGCTPLQRCWILQRGHGWSLWWRWVVLRIGALRRKVSHGATKEETTVLCLPQMDSRMLVLETRWLAACVTLWASCGRQQQDLSRLSKSTDLSWVAKLLQKQCLKIWLLAWRAVSGNLLRSVACSTFSHDAGKSLVGIHTASQSFFCLQRRRRQNV